jgi:3-isopropylmalate dehydrogenase
MLLRYGLELPEAAELVEEAIVAVVDAGGRTSDIARPGDPTLSTGEMGEEVARRVAKGSGVETVARG